MRQVLTERGDLLNAVFEKIFWTRLSGIQLLCYRWIVYRWRRSAVTDGECKHNTSNEPFSRCRNVTGKNWRWQHTVWLQVQKWTESENSNLVRYDCVVTMHDYTTDTNDSMTTNTDFHIEHTNTNTWVCTVSSCLSQRIVILHFGSSRESCVHLSSHPRALMMCAVLPRHWSLLSLHLLPHAPPVALLPLLHPLEVRRQPAHSAQREYGLHGRDLLPHKLWAATPTTSRRLTSSPTQSSWPRRRSSPSEGFPRTPITMTLHSRVCFVKLTEYIAITLNEKTCLSVCRRQCPTERSDPLETERGDLLSKVVRMHRLGLCSTNKKANSCRVPSKN